jgi:hypothetical protein
MKIRDVITDHGLDARNSGQQYSFATCPVCMNAASLMIDLGGNTFTCKAKGCGVHGDAAKLDSLVRRVRSDSRLR